MMFAYNMILVNRNTRRRVLTSEVLEKNELKISNVETDF